MEKKNYRIRQLIDGRWVAEIKPVPFIPWWFGVSPLGHIWKIGSQPYNDFCVKEKETDAIKCLAARGI